MFSEYKRNIKNKQRKRKENRENIFIKVSLRQKKKQNCLVKKLMKCFSF